MRIMAVILLTMVTVSASAQYYMNVVQKDGKTVQYSVADIENVIITDQKNYEYVDLGLSVKWATCNIGAERPEDFGGYYCWGETETKSYYSSSNYKYSDDHLIILKKYNFVSLFGNVDNKYTLDPEDDAAHVQWGGNWRLPSEAEFYELIANCTLTWTTLNDVKGCLVTSNKEGYTDRSIFLPASGIMEDVGSLYEGERGFYWTNSLTNEPMNANILLLEERRPYSSAATRSYGCCIRPVF